LHAAGVLDDGLLTDQTPRRMRVVAEAKVRGFLRLAMLPELRSVDFVVLFSSIAGALGTRGQGNYAAANAVLDAMAHALRAQGVPATSIGFGPFAGRGLATRGRRLQVLADRGIGAMRLTVVGNALDALAGSSVAHEVVAALDPVTWMTTHAAAVERLRFAAFDVIDLTSSSVADPRATTTLRERVSAVPGVRQRADLLLEFVRAEVAGVLRTSVDRVEPLKALRTMGIDSLTALELRNRLEQATTLRLPGTLVFTYPTAAAIATHLLECLAPVDAAPGPETVVGAAPADGASVAEETGDDEFDALVREMATMDEAELARLLDGPVGGTGA
jgi:acyl carrier protein